MSDKSAGISSLVLGAACVTLIVTVLRLVGELQGWSPLWFNNAGPDPEKRQGLFGIAFLVPIFGFWFGWRLRRNTGKPAHAGKTALVYLLGVAVLAGGFMAATKMGLIVMPTREAPGVPNGMLWAVVLVGAAILVALVAWPRLSGALFVYALLARIPVIVITFLAVSRGWDTHYVKLPPEFALPAETSLPVFLSMPQATFWIAFTMLVGGVFGCLGAALARRKG